MVARLIEKCGPAVQFEAPEPATKGERTRSRIMDIAYDAIVQKGFAATSIEELVEAAGITKSGFFYHFKDKNDLARQLLERFLAEDAAVIDTLTQRARALADDPLQSLLIFLNLYAEMMDEMPELHPGCLVATITYQERLFDPDVQRMNVDSILSLRQHFADWMREIAAQRPLREGLDIDTLADGLTVTVEGAIILSKALKDPAIMGRQMRHYRALVRYAFEG